MSKLLILSAVLIVLILATAVAIWSRRQKPSRRASSDEELRELRDKFARQIIKHDEMIEQKKLEDTIPELRDFSLQGLYEMRSYLVNAYNRADETLKLRAKEKK